MNVYETVVSHSHRGFTYIRSQRHPFRVKFEAIGCSSIFLAGLGIDGGTFLWKQCWRDSERNPFCPSIKDEGQVNASQSGLESIQHLGG